MRKYKVNGIKHYVYEEDDMIPKDVRKSARRDWRSGNVGDWVLADDGCIIQILRRGQMLRAKGKDKVREYVGTCTGTFPVGKTVKMDTSRRINIYSFGGNKKVDDILLDRTTLSKHEHLFVVYLMSGLSPRDSYIKAYPTNNIRYADHKSAQLVKTERILTAMKEELKPICEKLNIHPESVLSGIQHEATTAEKSDTRLKALFKLSDILDLEDKNRTTVTQMAIGAFKGFTPEEIEGIRPKEIGDGTEGE